MHLTREAIRELLTTRDREVGFDHLAFCSTCGAVANEIALDLGIGESLAWELSKLPDLPESDRARDREAHANELVALGVSAPELIRDPLFATESGLLALLRASHRLLNIDPSRLRGIADAVLSTSNDAAVRSDAVSVMALRERANALRRLGDLPESLATIARGRHIAQRLVVSEHELAIFDYIEATVLTDQSLPEAARQLALASLATFMRFGDTRRALYARLLLAEVQNQMGEYESARLGFESLVAPLAEIGDRATSAGALQNAACCALELMEPDSARRNLIAAEREYGALGLTTELLRVRWLRARVALEERQYDDAEHALATVADELEEKGLKLDAALARLDLVDLFQQIDRRDEAATLARALATVFAAAGARGRLADALTILREAVDRGWALEDPLREAREAVSELIASSPQA